MKKFLFGLGIFAVIVLMFLGSFFGYVNDTYNSFTYKKQAVQAQWGQVENVYQRRVDLIPNLVEATKGIFEQEREVFGAIAEARSHYAGSSNSQEKIQATNQLESALARLMVVIENYPQLRSSDTVNGLMYEMAGTENRITVERQRFNDLARIYNTDTKTFVGRFLASFFGFEEVPYFVAPTRAAQFAPKVNLSLK